MLGCSRGDGWPVEHSFSLHTKATPGFGDQLVVDVCGVSVCVIVVFGSQDSHVHSDQPCRACSALPDNTFVTEYGVFNLYRIVRIFY